MRIPALALVAALALLAAACGGLGDEELPDELSDGDREEISETLEAFFDGVDQYNPMLASEVMLLPAELGIPEVERMVWEIGALQPEELRFGYQSLGPAAVISDGDGEPLFVQATAVTAFEPREFQLVRRAGNWRISAAPDLSVPPEAGPVALEAEVHRSIPLPDGAGRVVVGEIRNSGSENAQILNFAAVALDEAGRTLATGAGIHAFTILRPSERAPFRVEVQLRSGGEIAELRFVIVAKAVDPRDFVRLEEANVALLESEYVPSAEDAGVLLGKLRNDAFEGALAFFSAVAYGPDGQVLSVAGEPTRGHELQAGSVLDVEIALTELHALGLDDEVAEVRLLHWGLHTD